MRKDRKVRSRRRIAIAPPAVTVGVRRYSISWTNLAPGAVSDPPASPVA